MLKPPINELVDIAGSRYSLVIVVSKRARQIIDSEQQEGSDLVAKPIGMAINELYDGVITCKKV